VVPRHADLISWVLTPVATLTNSGDSMLGRPSRLVDLIVALCLPSYLSIFSGRNFVNLISPSGLVFEFDRCVSRLLSYVAKLNVNVLYTSVVFGVRCQGDCRFVVGEMCVGVVWGCSIFSGNNYSQEASFDALHCPIYSPSQEFRPPSFAFW
jgi:hypothetical protein